MFECQIDSWRETCRMRLRGRLDAQSAPEMLDRFRDLLHQGERRLVVDLAETVFVSSAGLRVFLLGQRELAAAGGEWVFYRPTAAVREVLNLSGFDQLLRLVEREEELAGWLGDSASGGCVETRQMGGLSVRFLRKAAPPGHLEILGDQGKLAAAGFAEADVVRVAAARFPHGTGIATVGDRFADYQDQFGEAVLIGGNFFYHPAVRRSMVDYVLAGQHSDRLHYNFLHGFGFDGAFHLRAAFEGQGEPIPMESLARELAGLARANVCGLVLVAESRGLRGMNLKRSPVLANRPADGKSILDAEHFGEWFNFPLEPTDAHQVLAGAGLLVRDPEAAPPAVRKLLPRDSRCHFHAVLFDGVPLTRQPDHLEEEIQRLVRDLEAKKVQHLLGQSCLGPGMAGLVELEA